MEASLNRGITTFGICYLVNLLAVSHALHYLDMGLITILVEKSLDTTGQKSQVLHLT
jgi:hypothetical protein